MTDAESTAATEQDVVEAALHFNLPVDPAAPVNQGGRVPPPADGLLGGQVRASLQANPEHLTGTIQIIHPNACGSSVFNISCREVQRLSYWEPRLQSQQQYLAILYNYPLPGSFFNGQEGGVPRNHVWVRFATPGIDHTIMSNLVSLLPTEIAAWPQWVRELHVQGCRYLLEDQCTGRATLSEWRSEVIRRRGEWVAAWERNEMPDF